MGRSAAERGAGAGGDAIIALAIWCESTMACILISRRSQKSSRNLLKPRFHLDPKCKMRGKRSKQYRKLMHQYGLTFGFREPYQVLLDAQMVQDSSRFKMDLVGGLEKTLHGKVKPSK